MQVARVDYIARAPEGKEVEELTKREIQKALQSKIPADQALALVSDRKAPAPKRRKTTRKPTRPKREEVVSAPVTPPVRATTSKRPRPQPRYSREVDEEYASKVDEIRESFRAILFDKDKNVIVECGVAELTKQLESLEGVNAI